MEFVVTTTALARPNIVRRTFSSFTRRMPDLRGAKLFINIDPIPNESLQQETLEAAREFFPDLEARIPSTPNFTAAINWLWSKADTPFIFHLEDDWIIGRVVRFTSLEKHLVPGVMQVNLRAYRYRYNKMVLSPSLIKKECYKGFAGKLNTKVNPEVQLRNADLFDFRPEMISTYGRGVVVRDIGRDWLDRQKLIKPIKSNFVRY